MDGKQFPCAPATDYNDPCPLNAFPPIVSPERSICWSIVRQLAILVSALLGCHHSMGANREIHAKPNIVVIFTDDQGYGDLSCFGSTTIRTPRIDSLAIDGTNFYDRMPTAQGFDYYYGTLGANDGGHVVFHENNERVGGTKDMASLTRLYTDKGIEFVRENQDRLFFLYLAHTMAHSVIDASPEFRGKSQGGLYGDTIEELDYHSGRLLDAIDEMGLRDNTLVIFTTDNGAWNNMQETLRKRHNGQVAWGSSGPQREGKGSTYEGGLRVPCLARWPGKIPAGRTSGWNSIACTAHRSIRHIGPDRLRSRSNFNLRTCIELATQVDVKRLNHPLRGNT